METELGLLNVRLVKLQAWAVHAYTSLGLLLGFAALVATVRGHPIVVAVLLGVAAVVDGTDGPMARRARVTERLPHFDGRKLDDITDYLNYVLIPVFAAYRFELVSGPWTAALAAALLAAAYGFCYQGAKTEDKFFTGFPNFWNIAVFYMYLLRFPPAVNGIILLFLAAMVFVPVKYLTTQTKPFRPLTLSLLAAWMVMIVVILAAFAHPDLLLVRLSLFYPVYYAAVSFYLHFRARAPKRRFEGRA